MGIAKVFCNKMSKCILDVRAYAIAEKAQKVWVRGHFNCGYLWQR
jgi:hypothetical protein